MRELAAFVLRTLKAFRANQGLLLAGAVAYYALLSIVPMLILVVIALSHVVGEAELLAAAARYLDWLIPGQGAALTGELGSFLQHRDVMGWVLLVTMLFFSSLAFTVLENAMSVIFVHRVAVKRRHFLISAILPYGYIVCLGMGMLVVTLAAGSLQDLGAQSVGLVGLYLLGLAGEILVITSIYLVMPVGRLSWRHALIGGATAALLWELTRHVLLWYLNSLSRISDVYGSLTTAIVILLSLEMAAIILLFGAQVIAEFERLERPGRKAPPKPFTTGNRLA